MQTKINRDVYESVFAFLNRNWWRLFLDVRGNFPIHSTLWSELNWSIEKDILELKLNKEKNE